MFIPKIFKQLSVIISLSFILSSNSFAEDLNVSYKESEILLTTKDSVKNTVFKRFDDLWVIFSDNKLSVEFDYKQLASFGITDIEELLVKNGKGYRFRFKDSVPSISFVEDYEKRTLAVKISKEKSKVRRSDTIKFRVDNNEKSNKIKQLYLDSTFVLDYAYSLKTGEKYVIAISNDKRLKSATKQINNELYFLPTYSGSVIISKNGDFLTITDEDVVSLTNEEDLFFIKAIKPNLETEISKFFYNTGIQMIEKQLRDYSKFNRDVARFKSSGEFSDALDQVNDALNSVDQLNYLKNNKKLLPITNKKLDTILIEESNIRDMSSEDDGFFEMSKQAQQELNHEKDDEKDVLVPDFSSDNLSFLMEKLRLSSIKQPSVFKKEKINLKRMQISAYRGYYAEILDLTKLLRLNISGEFPRGNKGLALYTLANAKLNRCDDIINLPEKSGSSYTKDIKLWKAYCLVNQEKYDVALSLFEDNFPRIQTYPLHIREDLMLAYAKALKGNDKYRKSIETLIKISKQNPNSKILEEVKFTLALNYLYDHEADLALNTFKSLVFAENDVVRYQSRLEYINMLLQKQDFNKNVLIDALEDLRFEFRDNKTELDATKTLASLYLQEDHLKQAMELYKYISIYFSKTESAKQATETLFNIFYNLFAKDQQTNSNVSNLSRLALFYDFIELTPSDHDGNNIISNVVDDLIDLELYDNAIKLLTIQLNYKTKDEDVAEKLGEKLADLYLKTGQLKNSLKTLILTQKNSLDKDYTNNAKIIKAKALIKFNKLDNAENLLKTIRDSLEAEYLLSDIYWYKNDYKDIINTLENIFLGKKVNLDEQGIIHLSYLMVSYGLTNNIDKLKQIQDLYLSELEKVDLKYKLDFLLKLAGDEVKVNKEDSKLLDVWQKVIDIDNDVSDFLVDYKKEADFRESLELRDYDKLINEHSSRLN